MEGTENDSGSCGNTFYYYGNSICPNEDNDSSENESLNVENTSQDEEVNELEEKLKDLNEKAANLEILIEDLELDKEEILDQAAISISKDYGKVAFESSLNGLLDEVDELAENEIQANQDFQQDLADITADNIIDTITIIIFIRI